MCLCVHMCVRALHLEDDVGFGGLGRQRQHVSSHGLRVQTVPEIASVGGDLCRQEQIKAQTQTEHRGVQADETQSAACSLSATDKTCTSAACMQVAAGCHLKPVVGA